MKKLALSIYNSFIRLFTKDKEYQISIEPMSLTELSKRSPSMAESISISIVLQVAHSGLSQFLTDKQKSDLDEAMPLICSNCLPQVKERVIEMESWETAIIIRDFQLKQNKPIPTTK